MIDALEGRRSVRRRATPLRRALWLGATLVALEILYLIVGNLFLWVGLRRIVSRSPDHTMIAYASAYTTLPGVAHVRAFRMRNQDLATQWVVDVEEADVTIELLDLVHQRFHASRVRASGVSFRLRRKLTTEGARAPRAASLPPIAGFEDPPLVAFGPPVDPATAPAGWTANLEDVVASVAEVWVDEWRLIGPATVRGGFFKSSRILEVGPASLDLDRAEASDRREGDVAPRGEAWIGGARALAALDVHIDVTIGTIDMREPITRAVSEVSMRGVLDGRVPDVDFLRVYLGVPPVVELDGGGGPLHVELAIRHGDVVPPSRLAFESAHLGLTRRPLELTSSFTLAVVVSRSAGGSLGTADLRVRRASIALVGHTGALPVIEEGRIHASGLPLRLATPLGIEHTTVDLPGRIPDLGWLVPRGHDGSAHVSGSATARVRAELDRRFVAAGSVEARSERATVDVGGFQIGARLAADVAFVDASYRTRGVLLRSGEVRADGVAITRSGRTHAGGSARLVVTAGRVAAGIPRDLAFSLVARHPDLGWIAYGSSKVGVTGRTGALSAKLLVPYPASLFEGSPAVSEIRGEVDASASGAAHYGDTSLRFDLTTSATIEALDFGRRSIRLVGVRVRARDVSIDRGGSHTKGWWGNFDTPRFAGNMRESVELAARVVTRCQSGAPFSSILASAGVIPGWVGSIFPMNDLGVTGDVKLHQGRVDFGLRAHGSSATVTADLHHANQAATGVVLVQTALVSVGITLERGKTHVKVFAGQAWLDERVRVVEAEEARVSATR